MLESLRLPDTAAAAASARDCLRAPAATEFLRNSEADARSANEPRRLWLIVPASDDVRE